jgi:hypothetical protein
VVCGERGVGKVRNERSDIVTRVESTPKKESEITGSEHTHKYTRGERGGVGKVRNERSDIVTRVESTPKKESEITGGEPTQLHTSEEWKKRRNKKAKE